MRRSWPATLLFLLPVILQGGLRAGESLPQFPAAQSNYILGCGGCHGPDGETNARMVPQLKGLVGYFLATPEGRDYLGRLPNIAFSTMSDKELAAALNFMVFDLGGASVPANAKPFDAVEVGRLRKKPLNEIALNKYREKIVDDLIEKHHASTDLRIYREDNYGDRN